MFLKIIIGFIFLMLGLLSYMWFLMAAELKAKKIHKIRTRRLNQSFADLISEFLFTENDEQIILEIKKLFKKTGSDDRNKEYIQFLVDLMIDTENYFLGDYHHKVMSLYDELPPFKFSYNKTNAEKWYVVASGIREIYEMDQDDYLKHVQQFRNHHNVYIRREAQIALVVFLGWKSLRFLTYLKYRMTLWQQIKIVEKLHNYYPEPDLRILGKCVANSEISESSKELLIRIIRKFKIIAYIDFMIKELESDSYDVRETVLFCLHSFDLEDAHLLKIQEAFHKIPDRSQKLQIIKLHQGYPVENHIGFYREVLKQNERTHQRAIAAMLWHTEYHQELDFLIAQKVISID